MYNYMRTPTVYNLVDQVHNISKQRNKVLHVMHIAVLLIQYCLGYLAPGSRRAHQSSGYKHAPVISNFTSGPKGMHITGVYCTKIQLVNQQIKTENPKSNLYEDKEVCRCITFTPFSLSY